MLISVWHLQFLNPWIMVKKGGKLPEGHINDWFWENKDMKGYIASRLPAGLPSLPFISDVPIVMEPVYRAMYAQEMLGQKHTRQSLFGLHNSASSRPITSRIEFCD